MEQVIHGPQVAHAAGWLVMRRVSQAQADAQAKATTEKLDSQTLAALGTARVDHSAATSGFHANQKAMGTGSAGFGGLVGALHEKFSLLLKVFIRETHHYLKNPSPLFPCPSRRPRIGDQRLWINF